MALLAVVDALISRLRKANAPAVEESRALAPGPVAEADPGAARASSAQKGYTFGLNPKWGWALTSFALFGAAAVSAFITASSDHPAMTASVGQPFHFTRWVQASSAFWLGVGAAAASLLSLALTAVRPRRKG